MKSAIRSKKKAVRLILLSLLVILCAYVGIDQIIFQTKKDTIISFAKQYQTSLTTTNSISREDYSKGADWIVKRQRQKVEQLVKMYSFQPKDDNMISIYTKSLEAGLNDNWIWTDVTIDQLKDVSAIKYPFDSKIYVTLTYRISFQCEKGGAVLYNENVNQLGKDGNNSEMQIYCRTDYCLKYDDGWKIGITNDTSTNHPIQ